MGADARDLERARGFGKVVVATGHMTDAPDREAPRFPESQVDDVTRRVGEVLERWEVGRGDLLICGGARGGDIIAAEEAGRRGCEVWVLLANPPAEFELHSVDGGAPRWVERFRSLLARSPWWVLDANRLGIDPGADGGAPDDHLYEVANEWMLEVAEHQAPGSFRVLAVWDGKAAPGAGGAGHMVEEAVGMGATVEVVDPLAVVT
jgi:hypothetical protein